MTNNPGNIDLGPLEALLEDPDITEIMVNGMNGVFIEKRGQLSKTDVAFKSEDHIVEIIRSIFSMVNRDIDPEKTSVIDARLADGSRINAVFPPVAVTGPTLTIRKYLKGRLTWDDLIRYGSLNQKLLDFLRACVIAKRNILIAGGTSSGKTTIMNALTEFIPDDERIATVEPLIELQVRHPHLIMLEAQSETRGGSEKITVADLLKNTSHMRIDRILTGEVTTDGAWEMLQVMNSGHDGSMFLMHATSPLDALERLEMTIAMGGASLPLLQIRQQIASALDMIVVQMRLPNGKRRIVAVTEVTGIRNGVIDMHNIFEHVPDETDKGGKTVTTGYKPTFLKHLEYAGVALPDDFFDATEA